MLPLGRSSAAGARDRDGQDKGADPSADHLEASNVAALVSDADLVSIAERELLRSDLDLGLFPEILSPGLVSSKESSSKRAIDRLANKLRPKRALAIASSGVPALLVALLAPRGSPGLQADALALLNNVVQRSRSPEACDAVVAAGAVKACVLLLSREGEHKSLQKAAWALLNSLMCGSVRACGLVADSGLLQRAVAAVRADRCAQQADRTLHAARLLRAVGGSSSRSAAAGSELARAAVEAGALEGLCEALREQKRNGRRLAAEALEAFMRGGGPVEAQYAREAGVFEAVVGALARVRSSQTVFGLRLGDVEHESVRRPCLAVLARAAEEGAQEQVADLVACGAVTLLAQELGRDNDEAVVLAALSALDAILDVGDVEFEELLNEHSAVFAAARVPDLVEALALRAESTPTAADSAASDGPPALVRAEAPGLAAAAAARAFLKKHYPERQGLAPGASPAETVTAFDVVSVLIRALRLNN